MKVIQELAMARLALSEIGKGLINMQPSIVQHCAEPRFIDNHVNVLDAIVHHALNGKAHGLGDTHPYVAGMRRVMRETLVHQDKINSLTENSWQACVATLLHLKLEEVPDFNAWYQDRGEGQAWQDYLAWMAENRCFVAYFPGNGIHDAPYSMVLPGNAPILASVKSSEGEWAHNVIASADMQTVLHDPHRDGKPVDLGKTVGIQIIIPIARI